MLHVFNVKFFLDGKHPARARISPEARTAEASFRPTGNYAILARQFSGFTVITNLYGSHSIESVPKNNA